MTILNPYTNEPVSVPSQRDETPEPDSRAGLEYEPGPGKLIVFREKVARKYEGTDLAKPPDVIEEEERRSIYAKVVRVGRPRVLSADVLDEPWFDEGDKITIEPSLFREVTLSPSLTVWLGPFAGVTGKFTAKKASE